MAWKHRTPAQETAIIELTRDHCQREIAELVQVSKAVVIDVQRKYHLVLRFGRSSSSAQFRYRFDEYRWGRAIELLYWERRLPLEEVARRCGLDVGTVRRRMDRLGIARRTPAESNRGTKRGTYQAWLTKLPRCAAGCGRGVGKEGERFCAACRRKVAHRAA